jgi:hypothetical protein
MKKFLFMSITTILIMLTLFVSCYERDDSVQPSYISSSSEEEEPTSSTELTTSTIYEGKHKLKSFSFNSYDPNERNFFILSSTSDTVTNLLSTNNKITLMWQNHSGEYITSTVSMKNIRVKFDDTLNEPYIKFRYTDVHYLHSESEEIPSLKSVVYILVVCKESDWILPKNIKEEY